MIKDGITGFLAKDDPDSWYKALSTAIRDKTSREGCVKKAKEYIKNYHSEKACVERIKEQMPEISAPIDNYLPCKPKAYSRRANN